MSSQKLSCAAGQRYFVRTRWVMISVMVEPVDAILYLFGLGDRVFEGFRLGLRRRGRRRD